MPLTTRRVLDLDIETVAAGFADPQWVPNRTTCWAYCWVDEGQVEVDALPVADFYDKEARREFMRPFLAQIARADILTGHNLLRFDLGVINSECLLLDLPLLKPVLVQDTIRLPKSKGFKKGQDNMAHALGVKAAKLPLDWASWESAYGDKALEVIKERCASDVLMHVQMREAMRQRGWLRAPRLWNP